METQQYIYEAIEAETGLDVFLVKEDEYYQFASHNPVTEDVLRSKYNMMIVNVERIDDLKLNEWVRVFVNLYNEE